MRDDGGDYKPEDYKDRNYSRHPNDYLPGLNISQSSGLAGVETDDNRIPGDWIDKIPGEAAVPGAGGGGGSSGLNGNFSSADFISREDDDDVIHYGFPHRSPGGVAAFPRAERYADPSDGGIHLLDDMSLSAISAGGCKSTTADDDSAASEISGLCEIEESEGNLSGDEGAEVQIKLLSASHTNTEV